ncbi:MAG: aminomethyl-transferring glycine dehydrogenase subunit GcvPB [Chloroflexota bacterium]|nr:aminomethyl-transferring glycine dehydrogenase subunit GcvPB [Chloroflexota bacterium]
MQRLPSSVEGKDKAMDRRRLLLDASVPGRTAATLPALDVPPSPLPASGLLRQALGLPEVSEVDLVRYFTHLSQLNYAVDSGFYPLGSCTMKYNPRWHEEAASLPGFAQLHPLQGETAVQGALKLMFELQLYLAEVAGLAGATLCPAAGAHGELTGMLIARAYHLDGPSTSSGAAPSAGSGPRLSPSERHRPDPARKKVLVPDSAHGTNPASATMAGFQVVTIPSDAQGNTDLEALRKVLSSEVAAVLITLPNTLGLFDPHIEEVCQMVHEAGGLVYGDGANLNALLGQVKLGELGFDLVHINVHKTFSTPHGGGGPGAGPLCVGEKLLPFLPTPLVAQRSDRSYYLAAPEKTIGRISAFQGNFGVLVRAYAYLRLLGAEGLRQVSENAVINANYLLSQLQELYHLPYHRRCMHEVVLSASRQKAKGVSALDIAKRLIDYGFHPPTMYFPLIVEEALMIEPTETESKETLDAFIAAMKAIAGEVEKDPLVVQAAPHHAPMARLDEARAARQPDLRWRPPAPQKDRGS